jgi:hypothetical protein
VGVADISPSDAYAIGDSAATAVGSLVHWNGTAWSPMTPECAQLGRLIIGDHRFRKARHRP